MFHLGAGASYRTDEEVRFRARPEANMLNRPADTGAIAADDTWAHSTRTGIRANRSEAAPG